MIAIAENVRQLAAKKRKVWPAKSNRASALGDPCLRKLVYMRIAWDKAAPISESLAGVFQTGNELEPVIERILSRAGQAATPRWRIVGTQTAINDKLLQDHQISGRIDGILQTENGQAWDNYGVVDIKTSSPNVFARLDGVESLDRFPWTKKYIAQLSTYGLGVGLGRCCLIFINKSNLYDAKLIEWELDMAFAESLLQKALTINAYIESGELPDKINNPDTCSRCEHAAHCMPDLEATGNLELCADPDLADLLTERAEAEPGKKEYDRIERELKKRLIQGQDIICGNYMVQWTQQEKKGFTVEPKTVWRRKVISISKDANGDQAE